MEKLPVTHETLEEMRTSFGEMVADLQNRLTDCSNRLTESTRRQDRANSALSDQVLELTRLIKGKSPSGSHHMPDGSVVKLTKTVKLDMPKFSGEDVEGWLFQVEEYFDFHGIPEESKMRICGFHMTKAALDWFRGLRRNNLLSTWARFVEDARERFDDSEFVDKHL